MPAWQMAWAAGCTAHIRPIKCVFPGGSGPSQECQGGYPGAWRGLQHGFPALPNYYAPACSALSVHLKANLGVSWFSVDAWPRFYMTAPHRSGQVFPSDAPATAKLKRIIKQQSLHGDFVQKPYDMYIVLKKYWAFKFYDFMSSKATDLLSCSLFKACILFETVRKSMYNFFFLPTLGIKPGEI